MIDIAVDFGVISSKDTNVSYHIDMEFANKDFSQLDDEIVNKMYD